MKMWNLQINFKLMGISLANPILIELCIESEIVSKKKCIFFTWSAICANMAILYQNWNHQSAEEISNYALDIAFHWMNFRL